MDRFVSQETVIQELNISRTKLFTERKSGRLKSLKRGKRIFYRVSDIQQYVATCGERDA